jgi:vitamin B12 transporter
MFEAKDRSDSFFFTHVFMLKKIIIFSILIVTLFCNQRSYAQDSIDVTLLKTVNVKGKFKNNNVGLQTLVVEKPTFFIGSLGQGLQGYSQVNLRSYSAGGLQSLSIRGSSAAQVATIWQGMPISSATLGQLDFSLVPLALFDNVQMTIGGSSQQWGSGALGGTVQINGKSDLVVKNSLQLVSSGASFNNYQGMCSYYFSNNKFSNSTKVLYNDAENNIFFKDPKHNFKKLSRLNNARFNQQAIVQENSFKIYKTNLVSIRAWLQKTDRQIAPNIYATNSDEAQQDNHIRLHFEHKNNNQRVLWQNRVGFSKEELHYSSQVVNNLFKTQNIFAESEASFFYKQKVLFHIASSYQYANVVANNYISQAPFISKPSIFGDVTFKLHTHSKIQLGLRKEWTQLRQVPLVGHLGYDVDINKYNFLYANVARHYRLPTLNDLFWKTGGNPNLKSEQGFAQGIGWRNSNLKPLLIHVSTFSRIINDWIIWKPITNAFWQPENIGQVWSRGVEVEIEHNLIAKKETQFLNRISSSWIKSTNTKVDAFQSSSLYKQLPYIPIFNASHTIRIIKHGYELKCQTLLQGKRYTNTDNSNYLKKILLTDISFLKNIVHKRYSTYLSFGINNVWNTNYQFIENRAMPLRNYFVQINQQLNINKK